jgi:DMSO reductase family type II enzyme heme b subunit
LGAWPAAGAPAEKRAAAPAQKHAGAATGKVAAALTEKAAAAPARDQNGAATGKAAAVLTQKHAGAPTEKAAGAPARGADGAPAITVVRVRHVGPVADPAAPVWTLAKPTRVAMAPQVIVPPMKLDAAIKELSVRAVHNGAWIAFLIEWKDPSQSDRIVVDNFGDQVAVELPIKKEPLPSPMMGNPGGRVNIMQWRAALQRDLDYGPSTVRDRYPNAWVDVYPDEVLNAADARPYTGALGLDNPVSQADLSPVLDQMAEGWGTLTVKPDQHALGKGIWWEGAWHVVIARPMASDDADAPQLAPGDRTVAAFAAWEGGSREVGARKSWSSWVPVVLQK